MIPEYGHFALIIALFFSLALSIIPMVGSYNGKVVWMQSSKSLTAGMALFITISLILLGWSFYVDDFTVKYVAGHSNSLLPTQYKVTAIWGGHEGSMLLWVFILAGWTFAVSYFSKSLPLNFLARVLSVLGMVTVGFLLFILLTSNPFDRTLPLPPTDGSDLNPFLQDPGFIFHPPMLYMGYVGFAVIFSFAIAALLTGRFDATWAKWCRPWGNLAWCFLTVGIALGSWWAYYELGWGGWWFWDPVENASFMPWLVGTAFIHSLAITEKRGLFKNWTLFLAILAFSLSLLGTLLVRSGLLTSVHAFASDPSRGLFIGGFLFVVIISSLVLFALRAPLVKSESGFTLLSKDAFMFLNTIIFFISTAVVLIGTLYPIITMALDIGAISIGAPYYNLMFTYLMGMAAISTGIVVTLNWKRTEASRVKTWLKSPLFYALWAGTALPGMIDDGYSISSAITIFLGSWVIFSTIGDLYRRARPRLKGLKGFKKLSPSYYAMVIAHIGFAVCLLGSALNMIYSVERDVRLQIGKPITVGDFEYELIDLRQARGPNYSTVISEVVVRDEGKLISTMYPEKRSYFSGGSIMSEVALDVTFFRDLYVAMGEQLDNTAWSMRVHYKPFVRWVWLGAILMALGGLIAVFDKRYRTKKIVGLTSNVVAESDAITGKGNAVDETSNEKTQDDDELKHQPV